MIFHSLRVALRPVSELVRLLMMLKIMDHRLRIVKQDIRIRQAMREVKHHERYQLDISSHTCS